MLILKYTTRQFKYRLNQSYYCTKTNKNVYSSTVLLTNTKMPLRLEKEKLIARDENLNKLHNEIYKWQETALINREVFVLHDGPPYANGSPHTGHAINKILKDTIIRTQLIKGKRVNYIPGWDCHGLPIELKAVKQSKSGLNSLEIRQKARNFAKQTIEKQKAAFQSWGVIGNWDNPYKTFDKHYISNQLQQFYNLYEKNLIYRDVKPVYWSPSSKTALAEAELEYNPNHVSNAITVKLEVLNKPEQLKKYSSIHLLIWTTTPWTLPGNQAVCYNKKLSYSILQGMNSEEVYLIATDLIESYNKLIGHNHQVLETFSGDILENISYSHPFYKEELKLLHSQHATSAKGTGLVHCAPAHGPEDFLVALEYNMKIKCLVDENGAYVNETGLGLEGVSVLDMGNQKIIEFLGDKVVHKEDFVHSYPYDWRTKKPVILRASQQWFIDMTPIKEAAIVEVEKTEFMPKVNGDKYKKNLIDQIKKRPYWCISRQRSWGVPIPVFYDKNTNDHLLNRETIDHLCKILNNTDADFWWKQPLENLLPTSLHNQLQDLRKGEDILDIWFDSGLSWSSVLEEPKVADLYLEGVDQFTGWFQSSLITSVGLRNHAPYKAIYVHGFALDENGVKMSKSLGNVVDPQEIMNGGKKKQAYGVDTLRWWVACHANQDTTTLISNNVLKASSDEVQKIRSSLRFALGSISDYNLAKINYEQLNLIDKYMLNLLYNYSQQVEVYLKDYQFHKVSSMLINLVTNEISAIYYTAIKDRLYCDAEDSQSRRSAQYVLYQLVNILTQSIAPIVPHLAEEVYSYFPKQLKDSEALFMRLEHVKVDKTWQNGSIMEIMSVLLDLRKDIYRKVDNTGEALESKIEILLPEVVINKIKEQASLNDLCDILQVSEVELIPLKEKQHQDVKITKSEQYKCPRCRKVNAFMPKTLCDRCFTLVENLKTQHTATN